MRGWPPIALSLLFQVPRAEWRHAATAHVPSPLDAVKRWSLFVGHPGTGASRDRDRREERLPARQCQANAAVACLAANYSVEGADLDTALQMGSTGDSPSGLPGIAYNGRLCTRQGRDRPQGSSWDGVRTGLACRCK